MPATPRLLELQQGFAGAMLGHGDDVSRWIDGAGLEASARLRVYRQAIAGTLQAVLCDTNPLVMALVGEAFFDQLAERYRRAHPSSAGNVRHFGSAMADFIAAMPALQNLPYLPDIARLEWMRQGVALAADHLPAAPDTLAQWSRCDPAERRFELHPGVRTLRS